MAKKAKRKKGVRKKRVVKRTSKKKSISKARKKKVVRKKVIKSSKTRSKGVKHLEKLLENTPTKRHSRSLSLTLIITLVFIVTFFLFSVQYTGFVVSPQPSEQLFETVLILDTSDNLNSGGFKVYDVNKNPNSMLVVNSNSEVNSQIFVEIDDCGYWKDGDDRDNNVMYVIPEVRNAKFNVGDPSLNTIQQVELYKSHYLCLIFINKDINAGEVRLSVQETDKDKWTII